MIGMTRANAINTFGNLRFHWPEYLMEAGECNKVAIAHVENMYKQSGQTCYR